MPSLLTLTHNGLTYNESSRDDLINAGVPAEDIDAHILVEAKATKLKDAAEAAQAFVDAAVKDDSPAFEQSTYALQAAEATAWELDKKASTPILDGIAAARGVPADELKAKAAAKSKAYQTLCAAVAGQRQAFEDRINVCKTLTDVESIVIVFNI